MDITEVGYCRRLLDAFPDAILMCRPVTDGGGTITDFRYTYLNAAALAMAGHPAEAMLGGTMLDFFPESRDSDLFTGYSRVMRTGVPLQTEVRFTGGRVDGWFRTTAVRVQDTIAITVTDITRAKQAEADLRAALELRTLLMREMNHRVKNSLQMVAALIQLHKGGSRDTATRRLCDDIIGRVRTVAEVHRLLYQADDPSDGLESVDVTVLLRQVLDGLEDMGAASPAARLPDRPLPVPLDMAVPLGLIANELVTNAIRYAGTADDRCVEVILVSHAGAASLTVADRGPGLPPDLDWRTASSLGLLLVRTLVNQIGGRLDLATGPGGTRVTVTWPLSAEAAVAAR